jgi:hypothetical protein
MKIPLLLLIATLCFGVESATTPATPTETPKVSQEPVYIVKNLPELIVIMQASIEQCKDPATKTLLAANMNSWLQNNIISGPPQTKKE